MQGGQSFGNRGRKFDESMRREMDFRQPDVNAGKEADAMGESARAVRMSARAAQTPLRHHRPDRDG